jgi:hypothetical protein
MNRFSAPPGAKPVCSAQQRSSQTGRGRGAMPAQGLSELARVRRAHIAAAKLVREDPVYLPIFRAFEQDLEELEALERAYRATLETTL